MSGSEASPTTHNCVCSNKLDNSIIGRKSDSSRNKNKSVLSGHPVDAKLAKCCAAASENCRRRASGSDNSCCEKHSVKRSRICRDRKSSRRPCTHNTERQPSDNDSDDESNDESDDNVAEPSEKNEPSWRLKESIMQPNSYGSGSIKRMSFQQAVTYIPFFDGDPDGLNLFCKRCEKFYKRTGHSTNVSFCCI